MKHRRRTRGRGLANWAKKGLKVVRQHKLASRGAQALYNRYGSTALGKIKNKTVRGIANKAVKFGISQLKQRGYGLSRAGGALRRAGNGRRRRRCRC